MNIAVCMLIVSLIGGLSVGRTRGYIGERIETLIPKRVSGQQRIGLRAVMAHIMSTLRNGGTAIQAFQDLAGYTYPTAMLSIERVQQVCESRASEHEPQAVIKQVCVELYMAYALSERIGCETSRCLQVVIDAYKRAQLLHDLREQALATPRATARLLAALPLLTLVLGEAMGAHPLQFLCTTKLGWICLTAAIIWYAVGLIWIYRLLSRVQDSQAFDGQVFAHTIQAQVQRRTIRATRHRQYSLRRAVGI